MPPRSQNLLLERAEVFKALGQPLRLAIVEYLSLGERCVQEIVEHVGAEQSNVSRHLSVLRHAGVVNSERRGLCVYYSLALPCVTDLSDRIEAELNGDVPPPRKARKASRKKS